METKHTPAPWKIDLEECSYNEYNTYFISIGAENVKNLCHVFGEEADDKANAKLIAAAPELLEALQSLLSKYLFNQTKAQKKNNHLDEALFKAEAAIKKATE